MGAVTIYNLLQIRVNVTQVMPVSKHLSQLSQRC